jgi:DNA-binding CsgD family transcriptional regulator
LISKPSLLSFPRRWHIGITIAEYPSAECGTTSSEPLSKEVNEMSRFVEEQSGNTGTAMVRVMGEGFVEPDVERAGVDLRTGSGILVLSTEAGVLYMNKKGSELLNQMKADPRNLGTELPGVITQVCAEISKVYGATVGSKELEEFEIRRTAGTADRPVLVRGFCLPGGPKDKQPSVLLILEPIGRQQKIAHQGKERFQLTNREQHIVENLVKGWTNKEIACALGIAEPTVKAHMKHIMEKTKCTTRTGVLAQLM